jgi:hypothetical protein
MNAKKSLGNRIRGWLPKEPVSFNSGRSKIDEVKIRPKTETEAKAFKIASVTNLIMLMTFLGTHLLIDPYNRSIEVSIISWSIFAPSLILVNVLIYRHFKKAHP